MRVPELSALVICGYVLLYVRTLSVCVCHPAVAEHDLVTHFIAALQPALRRIFGTDPAGAEWSDLNALVNFANVKEVDLSLGTDIYIYIYTYIYI